MHGIAAKLHSTKIDSVVRMEKYTGQIVTTNGGSSWILSAIGPVQSDGHSENTTPAGHYNLVAAVGIPPPRPLHPFCLMQA
jgi:hypothetical protein